MLKRLGRIVYLTLIVAHLLAPFAMAQQSEEVLVVDVTGPVTPIMLSFIERAIDEAELRNVEALVIRLDTPGGSVDLTQRIIRVMMASEVPVVIYVWPPGGMAASAGTFITLAGHAAAMSPNTTIGAASPVSGTGEEVDETMRAKIENILTAEIRNLADRRSEEAIEWAQETVTEAKAATANEALEIGVIDFVATDTEDLLQQLDGFVVDVQGEEVTLNTADAEITTMESTMLEDFLGLLTNPSIAVLLISIGGLALAYEFINPGGYIGGIIGVIMLLLGFYAVGQLPVNYAGIALIVLAFILFVAEVFTPTFGVLTAAGLASFIFGGAILFNTQEFSYQLPIPGLVAGGLILAGVIGFGMRKVVESRQFQATTGVEGLVGSVGTVRATLKPSGRVFVWGELWNAISSDGQTIHKGEEVEVQEIDGFKLKVRKK